MCSICQLKKCLRVPKQEVPLEELHMKEDLTYTKYAIKILETAKRVTRSKVISRCARCNGIDS